MGDDTEDKVGVAHTQEAARVLDRPLTLAQMPPEPMLIAPDRYCYGVGVCSGLMKVWTRAVDIPAAAGIRPARRHQPQQEKAICRSLSPADQTITAQITRYTIVVPKSGCLKIKAAGIAT